MHLFYFIAFIAVFLGIQGANALTLLSITKKVLADKTPSLFLVQEATLLVNYAGFFLLIYLLSGFWSWPLLLAFVASAHLGTVFALILWGFLESGEPRWFARAGWAGGEWGVKNPLVVVLVMIASIVILVGYPIIAGIAYFGHENSSELTTWIFKYTIIFIVFSMLAGLIISIPSLNSENVDENTRTRFLVNQVGALVPTALFLALGFFIFAGVPVDRTSIISIRLLPVLILLLAYFVLTALLPYLLGMRRAKNQRLALTEQRKRWLEELWVALSKPSSTHYIERLQAVKAEIAASEDDLARKDKMIEWGRQIDSNAAPPEVKAIIPAYLRCRDMDPRFKHIDWMSELTLVIDEIIADLMRMSVNDGDEKVKFAKSWSENFRQQEEKQDAEHKAVREAKHPVAIAVSTVTIAILSAILTPLTTFLSDWASALLK